MFELTNRFMYRPNYEDIISLAKVLRSKTCLAILDYLVKKNASNQEIYDKLKDKIDIEYRSSVFEALKRIKDVGLVEKFYNDEDNQIKYKLKYKNISINLETMTLKKE